MGARTPSFCDKEGKCLAAVRMARMPESHKASLKAALKAELDVALAKRPDLRLVKAADGANDNWTFLHNDLPKGDKVVDFFHAAEHLNAAMAAAYGDGTVEARRRFADLRHVLLEQEGGVKMVIRSLIYLRDKHPRNPRIATELEYFRKHQRRMRAATIRAASVSMPRAAFSTRTTSVLTPSRFSSGPDEWKPFLHRPLNAGRQRSSLPPRRSLVRLPPRSSMLRCPRTPPLDVVIALFEPPQPGLAVQTGVPPPWLQPAGRAAPSLNRPSVDCGQPAVTKLALPPDAPACAEG